MAKEIVRIDNISMMFNLSSERIDSLKEYFVKLVTHKLFYNEFWALQDVSFSIKRGESLAIVGLNGSGKSTLLKLISGVMKPTKGSIQVNGTIAPLLELGAGFDMELSARENIYLNGSVLGYNKKEMSSKFEKIIEFSELHDFLDVPIKNFSSGMLARLGFAIATDVKPDLLILDEVLSVGDFKFAQKCDQRMEQMLAEGTTIILVSHSIKDVMKVCKKAIWLEKGRVKMFDDVEKVCETYEGKSLEKDSE